MSQAISPSTHKPYGLARTCRVWKMARSSVYWQRQERAEPSARRGPVGPCTDQELVALGQNTSPAAAIQLTEPQRAILEEMVRCRTRPQYEVTEVLQSKLDGV